MILGKEKLQEIYKDAGYEEGDYTPNGIDLRLQGVFIPAYDRQIYGISEGKKLIPNLKEMLAVENQYILYPGQKYFINVGHMDIPAGCMQEYRLRSTFMRCGCELESSWGDSGYSGDLIFALTLRGVGPVIISQNERIVQMVMSEIDGDAVYEGSYQDNQIYEQED